MKMSLKYLFIWQMLHLFHFSCGITMQTPREPSLREPEIVRLHVSVCSSSPPAHGCSRRSVASSRRRCRTYLQSSNCMEWIISDSL